MLSHDPQAQLQRSVDEFSKINPVRPIVPMGPAYSEGGWTPTGAEITWFMQKAQALGLSAVNFFSWDESHVRQPAIWDAIAKYPWSVDNTIKDITDLFIEALNTHNPDMVTALYAADAVHITGKRTLQGPVNIRGWYDDLITHRFPTNTFNLTGVDGTGPTRHFTWTTTSPYGNITDGNDTFGIVDGKIAYHYTYFNVT
ncbi:nuclear transport factor 2 family protein [bacterium]|nr:MAG: nuclear transport factor 2 family protein [bacterium]